MGFAMLNKYLISLAALSFALSACSAGETFVTGVGYVGATVADLDQTTAMYTSSASVEDVQNLDISSVKAFDKMIGRDDVKLSSRMLRSVNAQVRQKYSS